jgi:hypothetical protein
LAFETQRDVRIAFTKSRYTTAVNKAAKIFKIRSKNSRGMADALGGCSEADVSAAQSKLGAVCDFLVNRPELMEELEARVGGAKVGLSLTLNSVDP